MRSAEEGPARAAAPPSPALPPETPGGKGARIAPADSCTATPAEAGSKFNLPQGLLGEVGEFYEPGEGAPAPLDL